MSLIKFFSTVDEGFVKQHFKDPTEAEKFITRYRKKAKLVIGIVMSFMLLLSIAVGHASLKIGNIKTDKVQVKLLQKQVDECAVSSKQQMEDASASRVQAEKVNQAIEARLENCSKTSRR